MKVISVLISIFFIGCLVKQDTSVLKSVEKIGIAKNAKMGGIIVSNENEIFYIEGVEFWKEKYLGKKIVVMGELVAIYNNKINNDSTEIIQNQVSHTLIKNPKIRFAK
ncbi:MAG: hypothetical protein ACLGGV_03290 [Bacteroidia bacterium]